MIQFSQVFKQYHDVPALHDISFTIGKGELVFLAGPSGAGKTTLLKMIAAMERPTRGDIHVGGTALGRLKRATVPYLRRNLGLIFQEQYLLPHRTVLDNVMLPLLLTGAARSEAKQRAEAAIGRLFLSDKLHAYPPTLSGGQQQRLAIARAIVNRPQIILADEPTANLDRDNANHVLEALRSFHTAGVTCFISTHDQQFLDNATRVICLDKGRIVDHWRKVT